MINVIVKSNMALMLVMRNRFITFDLHHQLYMIQL